MKEDSVTTFVSLCLEMCEWTWPSFAEGQDVRDVFDKQRETEREKEDLKNDRVSLGKCGAHGVLIDGAGYVCDEDLAETRARRDKGEAPSQLDTRIEDCCLCDCGSFLERHNLTEHLDAAVEGVQTVSKLLRHLLVTFSTRQATRCSSRQEQDGEKDEMKDEISNQIFSFLFLSLSHNNDDGKEADDEFKEERGKDASRRWATLSGVRV